MNHLVERNCAKKYIIFDTILKPSTQIALLMTLILSFDIVPSQI